MAPRNTASAIANIKNTLSNAPRGSSNNAAVIAAIGSLFKDKNKIDLSSGVQQLQNTGGGTVGGSVAAPNALASLPQTPEIQALIDKGLLTADMTPQQIQAIIAIQGLRGQVPIDLKAIMDQLKLDYENYTGDILTAGQNWMQQLYGTVYDPNDPNAALFAQDPIFSTYAGGMAQLDETADLNLANDLAWFEKEQATQQAYYDMLSQMMMDPAALGIETGGSGGGGGRGGGGGGGGSEDEEELPWNTKGEFKSVEKIQDSLSTNAQFDAPDYAPVILDWFLNNDPENYEFIRGLIANAGWDPQKGATAFLNAAEELGTEREEGLAQILNNNTWLDLTPERAREAIDQWLQLYHMTTENADDPSTPQIEFITPDPLWTAANPGATAGPNAVDPFLSTWLANPDNAQKAEQWFDILTAAYDPEGFVSPDANRPTNYGKLTDTGWVEGGPWAYNTPVNPGGTAGLEQIAEEREAGRQNMAYASSIPGIQQQLAENNRPVGPNPFLSGVQGNTPSGFLTQDSLYYIYNVIGNPRITDQQAADWLRNPTQVEMLPEELMPQINRWIQRYRPGMFYTGPDLGYGVTNPGPFEGTPNTGFSWITPPPDNPMSDADWASFVRGVRVQKQPMRPANPFLFGNAGDPITLQDIVAEYQAGAITDEGVRQNILDLMKNQSAFNLNEADRYNVNPDWEPLPGEYWDVNAMTPEELAEIESQIQAANYAYYRSQASNPALGWANTYMKDWINTLQNVQLTTTSSTGEDEIAEQTQGDPNNPDVNTDVIDDTTYNDIYGNFPGFTEPPPPIPGESDDSLGGVSYKRLPGSGPNKTSSLTGDLINQVIQGLNQPKTTVSNPYVKQPVAGRINTQNLQNVDLQALATKKLMPQKKNVGAILSGIRKSVI
ncbi:MAG: hypothetical protein ABWY25_04310 [Paenisporosarcina sp.]